MPLSELKYSPRQCVDMLEYVKRMPMAKYPSYSLGFVSNRILGRTKTDMHHSFITQSHYGVDTDLRPFFENDDPDYSYTLPHQDLQSATALDYYAYIDAYLVNALMCRLAVVTDMVETSRLLGVTMQQQIEGGQQVRTQFILVKTCREKGRALYTRGCDEPRIQEKYEGGHVFDPEAGYYEMAIATLDFASLYPSIMIANNMCYSTLLTPQQRDRMDPKDYYLMETGAAFVKEHIRVGMLPTLLKELLSSRAANRKLARAEKDPMLKAVYNSRQLSRKVAANSVYGYTGAGVGKNPCKTIAYAVTKEGQTHILKVQNFVEQLDRMPGHTDLPDDGRKCPYPVIYGDTDSVMVNLGTKDEEMMCKVLVYIANACSEALYPGEDNTMVLEPEKIAKPYLLIGKKRYAGRVAEFDPVKGTIKQWKLSVSGLECTRRDNSLLLRETMSGWLKYIQEGKIKEGVKFVKAQVQGVWDGTHDFGKYIISKSLSKEPDEYSVKSTHVNLAAKMARRSKSKQSQSNRRIPYIVRRATEFKQKVSFQGEDPIFAFKNNVPIDQTYYIEKQLKKPMSRVMIPVIGKRRFKLIFSSQTVRVRATRTKKRKRGLIESFMTIKPVCEMCGSQIQHKRQRMANGKAPHRQSHGSDRICDTCQTAPERTQGLMADIEDLDVQVAAMRKKCQDCQGQFNNNPNACQNIDCEIFFARQTKRQEYEKKLSLAQELELVC